MEKSNECIYANANYKESIIESFKRNAKLISKIEDIVSKLKNEISEMKKTNNVQETETSKKNEKYYEKLYKVEYDRFCRIDMNSRILMLQRYHVFLHKKLENFKKQCGITADGNKKESLQLKEKLICEKLKKESQKSK